MFNTHTPHRMAQWVEGLATKPEGLSLISSTQRVEGSKQLPSEFHKRSVARGHPQTHTKQIKSFFLIDFLKHRLKRKAKMTALTEKQSRAETVLQTETKSICQILD